MKALFCTAVWGDAYLDRFLNYSLRTQLSAGNLGAFDTNSLFLIITDSGSLDRITSSPSYKSLAELVSVECVVQDVLTKGARQGKYSILAQCQNYALRRAAQFDAVFFGYADALWSEGSYRAAARRIDEGHDVVFAMGYPVIDKAFSNAIDRIAPPIGAVSIEPRVFARHVYDHLHPMARANHWNNAWMSSILSYLVWDIPGQGILTRAFHQHPVAMRVRADLPELFYPFRTTLDEEFVARLFRTNPRIHVFTNSDELVVCSLAVDTGQSYAMEPRRPPNIGDLAVFAEAHAGLLHRELFRHPVRLHIDDFAEALWKPAEAEAAAVAEDVQRALNTPDSVLALESPVAYEARQRRQRTYRHWHKMERTAALWAANQDFSPSLARLYTPYFIVGILELLHTLYVTRLVRRAILLLLGKEYEERATAAVRRVMKNKPRLYWQMSLIDWLRNRLYRLRRWSSRLGR